MEYHDGMIQLADEYFAEAKEAFFANRQKEAAILTQNAIGLYREQKKYDKYAAALNLMGVIYATMGNETMATDYYLEALDYAVDYNRLLSIALYNNIGTDYQEFHEHEEAVKYFLKSVKELENTEYKKEENYNSWCVASYMNLADSYRELGKYELAFFYITIGERYLGKKEEHFWFYTFLISKCRLYWCMGKKQYVYDNLEQLLQSGTENKNTSNYVQDIKSLCSLLYQMGEYEHWKSMLLALDAYVKVENTVYLRLIQNEMWMDYYYETDNQAMYRQLCVEHISLYRKQKEVINGERIKVIDMKIKLREKEVERRQTEEKMLTDALTGLGNRYLLEREIKHFLLPAANERRRITVGVLDIDCFKQLNDTYGHIHGDNCIKQVAAILEQSVGVYGNAYRFGGDEFVLLLSVEEKTQIQEIAEDIKKLIADAKIENKNSAVLQEITISQGYICFIPQGTETLEQLIERADQALYYRKENGRNGYHIMVE